MPRKLSLQLLNAIMRRMAEKQDQPPSWIKTGTFEDLLGAEGELGNELQRRRYLNRHLDYLETEGYITIGGRSIGDEYHGIALTAVGQRFIQPELAEFGEPMLPQIVAYVDEQIDVHFQSEADKQSLKYKLREAVADRAIDALVKLIAEIIARTIRGGT